MAEEQNQRFAQLLPSTAMGELSPLPRQNHPVFTFTDFTQVRICLYKTKISVFYTCLSFI